MLLSILKIVLAPVLVIQGKQVKQNTPRLPEAGGPRKGVRGDGEKQIRLLILGDSAAAGVGVDHQDHALAGQILACFGPDYRVEWTLKAKTGVTTKKTLEYLEALAPDVFDVAVTSLGVNDVIADISPELWTQQQKQLVSLLREKFQVHRFIISAVPPMAIFPAIPQPLGWYLGMRAARMNRLLKAWLKDQAGCEFVEFDLPMDPALMAADGFHPGPGLHTLWGREISDRIISAARKDH